MPNPHFQGPTEDNDLGRLDLKQIDDGIKFASRANAAYNYVRRNGMPEGYAETIKEYEKANAGPINFEDIYALDQAISRTIYDVDIFAQIGIPTHVMTKPRFQLKDYLVKSNEWPRFSKKFQSPVFLNLNEDSDWSNGLGMHLGISIPFTEIRESQGALWGPREILMQELASKMGIHKSNRGFNGDGIPNARWDDGTTATRGITGLFNTSGNQTFAAGIGGDDICDAQGDIEFTMRTGLTDLKKVYQPGKVTVVSTSGFASQMFIERDTYQQKLDSERVKEVMTIVNGMAKGTTWGGWWVDDNLYNGTIDVTHQQCMIMKVGPSLMNNHIVYPQQMMPMANKNYEADIQENMIYGNIIQVKKVDTSYNAVPITIAADITTDSVGFIPNGAKIF